jgi:hypothetical protein
MKTIIIILLGINLYMLIDYILDNYYFNGTRTKEGLVLNRHLYYEFIQILLLVILVFITASLLPEFKGFALIYPICLIIFWCIRIRATYKNWACELQISKEKVIFIDNEGNENSIALPNHFSIKKQENARFSLSTGSSDYVLFVKNNNGEELIVNLSESSLDSYVTQIYKTVSQKFGTKSYDGIKPSKLNLKNLSISLLALAVIFFVFQVTK